MAVNFHVKLEYKPDYPDAPTYQVEIFANLMGAVHLVFFREITIWSATDIGPIQILPLEEFANRFKKFKAVGL